MTQSALPDPVQQWDNSAGSVSSRPFYSEGHSGSSGGCWPSTLLIAGPGVAGAAQSTRVSPKTSFLPHCGKKTSLASFSLWKIAAVQVVSCSALAGRSWVALLCFFVSSAYPELRLSDSGSNQTDLVRFDIWLPSRYITRYYRCKIFLKLSIQGNQRYIFYQHVLESSLQSYFINTNSFAKFGDIA